MIAKYPLGAITQASYPRHITALLAAMFAVPIDPIFRFSDYRDLLHLLPGAGYMKFSGTLTLVLLQVVVLFYLIVLLPRPLRTVPLLLSVFVVLLQFSYWLTLARFMAGTDLFLALTVGADTLGEAVLSFRNPLIFLYALPYVLVLSTLILVPLRSTFRKSLTLSLLPAFFLLASNYALFLHVPERNFHLNPLASFVRSTFHYEFETLREYHGPRDDLPTFHASQRPLDSIIYVIDESVRGSNLSLNGYPRSTTPFLQSLENQGRLKNLGICVAASSFSHISNAYLVTGHNAFPDDAFRTDWNHEGFGRSRFSKWSSE